METVNNDAIGWQEDLSENHSHHYYIFSDVDFDTAICGKYVCNKSLVLTEDEQDYCKACIANLDKLKKDGHLDIKMKATLV